MIEMKNPIDVKNEKNNPGVTKLPPARYHEWLALEVHSKMTDAFQRHKRENDIDNKSSLQKNVSLLKSLSQKPNNVHEALVLHRGNFKFIANDSQHQFLLFEHERLE